MRRWESIVSLFYADLISGPLIYYTAPGVSEWVDFKSAIFNTMDRNDEAVAVIMQVWQNCRSWFDLFLLYFVWFCCHLFDE